MQDTSGFEVFGRYHKRPLGHPTVTIQKRGMLSLNEAAWKALGEPEYAVLSFHRSAQHIGMGKVDSSHVHGIPVRLLPGGRYVVAGTAFTKYFDIDASVARRYQAKMQDELLIIDLKSESLVVTGPRAKQRPC